jgi:D-cysteine desulfhydrase
MSSIADLLNRPRVVLANLPTPITEVNFRWGAVRLFLKRDDLTGCALSGNKIRKLEYLIADAQARNCDTLVTCGGVQSNHTRATAVAATRTGMRSVLVLAGEPPSELDGNLLLSRMVGADVRILPPMSETERHSRMEAIADDLRTAGRRPYVMPSGGSNEVGALGYLRAMHEIQEQLATDSRGIGCIVHACGSGGTYVGCQVGRRLARMAPRHVACTVEGTVPGWRRRLSAYAASTAANWGVGGPPAENEIELIDAAGQGYAVNTDDEIRFMLAFARQTGVLLDPVYSGKALYALDREIRAGTFDPAGHVLFIHTGGVYGLFPKRHLLAHAIDQAPA